VQPLAPKGNTIASALKKSSSIFAPLFADLVCQSTEISSMSEPGRYPDSPGHPPAPEQQNCLAATHPLHAYLTTLRENANGFVAKRSLVAGARRMQRRSVLATGMESSFRETDHCEEANGFQAQGHQGRATGPNA